MTGSPRRGGNSELLADAFIKGAQQAGHTVIKYETAFKNIQGCQACHACYSHVNACVFDDDFNALAPMIEQSDVIVFATPLYWFNFPAQLKAAIDKIFALLIGNRQINIKESILLACAESSEESDFNGLVYTYDSIADYMKWTDLGKLLVPSVNDKGDILKTDALLKAELLGRILK